MDILPANIVELQLAIDLTVNEAGRALTRARVPTAPLTERWAGQIACAPKSSVDHRALVAWLEHRDGRVRPFGVTLGAGFASNAPEIAATLASVPALGSCELAVTLPAPATLLAGTLLTVGDIDSGPFQLFEVLADVDGSGTVTVSVAPRVRSVFTSGLDVVIGTVTGKFTLVSDDIAQSASPGRGTVTLDIVEAL